MKLSFSSIQNFLLCPKKFKEVNVDYNWRDASFAAASGTDVHKRIEDYITGRTEIADIKMTPRLDSRLKAAKLLFQNNTGVVKVSVEQPMAVNKDFELVPYKDNSAILRGKIDFLLQGVSGISIIDWKSGKMRDNKLQSDVYGLLTKPMAGNAKIRTEFDYLEKGIGDSYVVTDSDIDNAKKLVCQVLGATEFPTRPNGLCPWCPVRNCPHFKKEG